MVTKNICSSDQSKKNDQHHIETRKYQISGGSKIISNIRHMHDDTKYLVHKRQYNIIYVEAKTYLILCDSIKLQNIRKIQ